MDEDDIVADAALTGLASGRLLADWRADPDDQEPNRPGYGRAPAAVGRLVLADPAVAHGSLRGYAAELLGARDEPVAALRRNLADPPASVSRPRAA
ncbi:hypothetical protein [Streptomyces sp. NPDC005181]|uniref:hypothetical protein n=1 Tax=Streptomyces sp. NPDC005181 TaxID=3156869 RepID=UPI00339E3506